MKKPLKKSRDDEMVMILETRYLMRAQATCTLLCMVGLAFELHLDRLRVAKVWVRKGDVKAACKVQERFVDFYVLKTDGS